MPNKNSGIRCYNGKKGRHFSINEITQLSLFSICTNLGKGGSGWEWLNFANLIPEKNELFKLPYHFIEVHRWL